MTAPVAAAPRGSTPAERRRTREEPRRRPPLRVVGTRAGPGTRLGAGRLGLTAGAIFFASMFALAAFQAVLVDTQARIDAVEDRIETEQTRADRLELDLAELRSPARITREAEDRLGMVAPRTVVHLQPGQGTDPVPAP